LSNITQRITSNEELKALLKTHETPIYHITIDGTIISNDPIFQRQNNKLKEVDFQVGEPTPNTESIRLTLWENDAREYNQSDRIKITNAHITKWNNSYQLKAGPYSRIERIQEIKK